MDNILIFGNMLQAVILNPKLLEQIKKEEAKNREFEAEMDAKIAMECTQKKPNPAESHQAQRQS